VLLVTSKHRQTDRQTDTNRWADRQTDSI